MAGLDTIVDRIIEDSKAQAALKIAAAKERAAGIEDAHLQKASANRTQRLADAEKQAARIRSRGESAARTALRNALLTERNRLIDETVRAAFESLADAPPEEVFGQIRAFVASCPLDCPSTLILTARELGRMPQGFAEDLSAGLPYPVTVGPEPGTFTFGCVVVCGEIEYNGTAEGLMYEHRDEIRDLVYRILFSDEIKGAS